jgi:hypothetical protein
MGGVEQPGEFTTSPPSDQGHVNVQGGAHHPHGPQRERAHVPVLQVGYPFAADSGAARDIDLPPAATKPDGTEGTRHLNIPHSGHGGSRPLPDHPRCLSGA